MFSSFSCSFSHTAKFKDKFIFHGGHIGDKEDSLLIISENEATLDHSSSGRCIIDWWVVDCIRLKRILPLELYRPLHENPFLSAFRFHFFVLDGLDEFDDNNGNSLMTENEDINSVPLHLIKSLIVRFGGSLADVIDYRTTHIITQFECDHLLPTQLLGPVKFVTLSWLLKLLAVGKYSEPSEAIDFPCPIHPIPDSKNIVACLSGFPGSTRKLLEAQLSLMGITVSNDLCALRTTHLICSQRKGLKFETVQKWNDDVEKRLLDSQICFKAGSGAAPNDSPIHAPVTLKPTPFSSTAFLRAIHLQPTFNLLVLRTVQNCTLLRTVCSKLAESDTFVAKLFEIYCKYPDPPKLFFNVNRSDYMVEGDKIYQIELNTISASLAGLSTKLTELHKSIHKETHNIPDNQAAQGIVSGFQEAVNLYKSTYNKSVDANLGVLFIVQEGERNYYDQLHLQTLFPDDVKVLRKTLADPSVFDMNSTDKSLSVDGTEIAIVYFRAGYSPDEYLSPNYWKSRDLLESSRSIKCPDIGSHLAGLKKIQQVLTEPTFLLSTMNFDQNATDNLLSSFAGIYSLDDSVEGGKNTEMAISDPERFVLKPQREGGGNNTYGPQVKTALIKLSPTERSAFILMDRIRPPVNPTTILRNSTVKEIMAVSELGIYGAILASEGKVLLNEQVGWLLRTKPEESDEGGVVSGYSVLDVPDLK